MTKAIDLFAPIKPNRGLGGLQLRSHISGLSELLVGLGVSRPGTYELTRPFEATYSFGDGGVRCAVDVRNGKVFKLIATKDYKGKFGDRVHVGMTVKDAIAVEPRLFYSEAEECIFCKGVEGIVFDLPLEDPDPSEVPSLVITSIAVYAIEAFTATGQNGNW
jgi:hypothetical protein